MSIEKLGGVRPLNIGSLLFDQQKALFVGREKEVEIITQSTLNPKWKLLHVHGPATLSGHC